MAARAEYGWDIDVIGSLEMVVTDSGGSFTLSITTGTYCHTDISSVVSGYSDFATALQSNLNSGTSSGETYSVTWNGADQTYTIQITGGGNITLDFQIRGAPGTRLRHALGFSVGITSAANKQTSDMTPYYVLVSAMGGVSQVSYDYEPRGLVEEWETVSGAHGSVAPVSSTKYFDFTIPFESAAKTRKSEADDGTSANDIPWTFEHAQEHARGDEPFVLTTDSESTVHFMKAEAASFRVTAAQEDYDALYNWKFRTFLEGRL